jgi:thioredoxin 2
MSINVVCPNCLKVNRLPKKDSYNRANCGSCKNSLLESKPIEVDGAKLDFFMINSDLPLVIDFWAPWCGPCRIMAPAFEEASLSMPLKAQFLKVNTEDNQDLGARYSIKSIPTMVIFQNEKELDRVSGALSSQRIESWVLQR